MCLLLIILLNQNIKIKSNFWFFLLNANLITRFQIKKTVLMPRHISKQNRDSTINLISMLRNYLHYHLKCSKAYQHQRMRAKTNDFLKVLNRAKPEPRKVPVEEKKNYL